MSFGAVCFHLDNNVVAFFDTVDNVVGDKDGIGIEVIAGHHSYLYH